VMCFYNNIYKARVHNAQILLRMTASDQLPRPYTFIALHGSSIQLLSEACATPEFNETVLHTWELSR
ncbi:hypothetical protein ACQ10A_16265, partial [Enterococcus faecalis]|uniref:hypothetical protein n=1 Tax=Enterococcus faecalis TaxID=1351 RepID=UPI003D6B4435